MPYSKEKEKEMDLSFLLRGLIIGFSIAAPVGPIYKFAYWFYMAIICVF